MNEKGSGPYAPKDMKKKFRGGRSEKRDMWEGRHRKQLYVPRKRKEGERGYESHINDLGDLTKNEMGVGTRRLCRS